MSTDNDALYLILDTIDASIFWKDKTGRYLGCNRYMVQMSGFNSRDEVIGKKDRDMPWFKFADELERIDQSVLKNGVFEGEETPLTASLKKMIFHTKKTILYDKKKRVIGIIGISIDITKRKKAEQLLKKKQKQLFEEKNKAEAANKAKTEFLENMRHDIRTPLSGIIGFSELLKSESNEPRIKEYAENLVASSHALLDLMDEVLEAVRVSSGEIPMLKRKFDLIQTLDHLIDLYKARAYEKRLNLSLNVDSKVPQYVIGDKVRFHRIVLELVGNALNFTDVGNVHIHVELAKKKDSQLVIKLKVIDTGIGIPKEKQQEIYIQFKRLTPSYQGIYKGAGLGLYVVKQFIDELGGEIYVESELRKGSCFTCLIPLQEPLLNDASGIDSSENLISEKNYIAPLALQIASNPINLSIKTTIQILVVEDNIIAQSVAKSLLSGLGCNVDVVASGNDAIAFCKKKNYDLIFMDIGLGEGMDGYEVTYHIRNLQGEKKHTPIIALTAHAGDDNRQRCIGSGMDAVLTKPLTHAHATDILKTFVPSTHSSEPQKYQSELPEHDEDLFQLDKFHLFDHEQALKNCGTQSTLIELLNLMINQEIPVDLERMKKAFEEQDYSLVENVAHKIKGGAVYVGTTRMKYACQYLERYWKSGKNDLFDKLYYQAVKTIEDSCHYINDWIKKQ